MKNGLFVLSIGLMIVVTSAAGNQMEINYLSLTTGVFFSIIGLLLCLRSKRRENRKN